MLNYLCGVCEKVHFDAGKSGKEETRERIDEERGKESVDVENLCGKVV